MTSRTILSIHFLDKADTLCVDLDWDDIADFAGVGYSKTRVVQRGEFIEKNTRVPFPHVTPTNMGQRVPTTYLSIFVVTSPMVMIA